MKSFASLRFFSITTIAASLALHARTVRRAIAARKIKAVGNRIALEDVEDFLRMRSIGADAKAACFLDSAGRPRVFLSLADLAERLDYAPRTLSRRIRDERLEAYSLFPSTIRIPADAVDALLSHRQLLAA